MKKRLASFITGTLLLAAAASAGADGGPALSGWVRSQAGVLLQEEAGYSIVQNAFSLSIGQKGERLAFKLNPFARLDLEQSLELGLREAYLDLYFDSLELRIGQQQIIWGKGEGVFITDVVSPKDLRDFILPDFTEVRLGIPALRADYYLGGSTFELVLVPLFVPSRSPEPGSLWYQSPSFPVTPTLHPAVGPAAALESGELFARWSWLGAALDFELMGGLMWDDEPALHLTRTIDSGTGQVTAIDVQPRYHRLALAGGSFSTTLAGAVVRAEGAFYSGKRFATLAPADPDGLVQKDYLHYLAGLDFGLAGLDLSAQFVQRVILDYEDPVVQDRIDTTATFRVSDTLLRDTLRLELFAYVGLNEWDALLRPKVTWMAADGLEISAGAELFLGQGGTFGRYDDNDQVYLKAKVSF
jgi:hypothetical protein